MENRSRLCRCAVSRPPKLCHEKFQNSMPFWSRKAKRISCWNLKLIIGRNLGVEKVIYVICLEKLEARTLEGDVRATRCWKQGPQYLDQHWSFCDVRHQSHLCLRQQQKQKTRATCDNIFREFFIQVGKGPKSKKSHESESQWTKQRHK